MSDSIRLKTLFEFVVTCLAQAQELSQREIGRLLGAPSGAEARKLFLNFEKGNKKTVAELVSILAGLRNNRLNQYLYDANVPQQPERLITTEHIYLALQKLITLTPQEKEALKLPLDNSEVLLQQALLNMALYQKPWTEEHLLTVYRTSTSLNQSSGYDTFRSDSVDGDIDRFIEKSVEIYEREHLGYEQFGENSPTRMLKIVEKVKREVDRILLKAGTTQLNLKGIDSRDEYRKRYLTPSFINRLTQSVIENELLTEELPVFIDTITVERCGPCPLNVAQTFSESGSLCRSLLNFDTQTAPDLDHTEMASQTVNKVILKMHMRLTEEQSKALSEFTRPQLERQGHRGQELYFEVKSTGIGGNFSHVVKVLNHTLLNDMACLREYFPIAHEIMMEQNIISSGAPAPVIAHSLVKLCQVDALGQAIQASQRAGELQAYEKFSFNDPIGRGDFCGFDTLTSVANASLKARLKAIKFTGVPPKDYLDDLQKCIDRSFLLRKSHSYLSGYPFSSLAQENFIRIAFGDGWNKNLNQDDPLVYFKIQLELVGGFLLEGLCDRAKPYLDQLAALLDEISTQGIATYKYFGENIKLTEDFQIFTSTVLIRYELYQAHYAYLTNNPEEAWERLRKSETHVNLRLIKYSLIDEISQATFEPHYRLLAKIYFLRAQILMFAPFTAPMSRSTPSMNLPTDVEHRNNLRSKRSVHIGRLYLLEKARLYAACDGNSELYACITAYQCCIYLIASEAEVMPIEFDAQTFTLTQAQAKDWARRLRDAALLAYTEAGRHHYYKIKEKSGISEDRHHNFGKFTIDAIPTIREIQGDEEPGITEFVRKNGHPPEKVLHLDMAIMGLDSNLIRGIKGQERGETVYLLGTNACYLFFARGMYHSVAKILMSLVPLKPSSR